MNQSTIFTLALVTAGLLAGLHANTFAEDAGKRAKQKLKDDRFAQMLRRHYPHGIHKIRTSADDGSVEWRRQTLGEAEVSRSVERFASVGEFATALRDSSLDKKAYIEIVGIWTHAFPQDTDKEQDEAVLKVLRDYGYEEARFANLKKHYGPHGHHFINAQGADGKIRWNSSVIVMKRVIHKQREFASLDDFKRVFLAADVNKAADISVHHRGRLRLVGEPDLPKVIQDFLRDNGYEKVGAVSN